MVEEKPFRVLLDLSELNINVSKYVWMNVSPRELHNIEDFKNAVLRKLNFERRDIRLFVHDGLLPEDEKIIILRENDTIKLQYEEPVSLSSSFCILNSSKISTEADVENSEVTERKGTKKRKRRNEEVEDAVVDETVKSHKKKSKYSRSVSLEDNASFMKKSHKTKSSHSNSISLEDTSSTNVNEEIVIEDEEIVIEDEEESPVKDKAPEFVFNIHHDTVLDVQETALNTSQGSNCKKRKRKRHKKRKAKSEVLSIAPYNTVPDEKTQANSTSTFTDNYESIRKHIHFTSPTPNLYTSNELTSDSYPNTNAKNKSSNLEEVLTPGSSTNKSSSCINSPPTSKANAKYKYLNVSESFTPGSSLNKSSPHVNSTPTTKACYEQDSWDVSPMTNEKSKVSDGTTVPCSKKSTVTKTKKKSYPDYPPLNCLPTEGTRIVFKTLDLDESYCPVITPYKEGIVRKVNTKTEELYIEYIQEEIKPGRDGKFEILAQDEVPSDEIIKDVTLKWSSLIEPRCVTD